MEPDFKRQKIISPSYDASASSLKDVDMLYSPVPHSIVPTQLAPAMQLGKGGAQKFVETFVKGNLLDERREQIYQAKLADRSLLLDNPRPDAARQAELHEQHEQRRRLQQRKSVLSSRERRELHVFDLPPDCLLYASYEPLHALWCHYIDDLIGSASGAALEARMVKADLHGCKIMVTQSKSPTLVGLGGIVVQETENTFKIVTPANVLKVVPKANSVFTLRLGTLDTAVTIYGNQFCHRSYERSVRKFKPKPTIEMV